MHYTVSLLKDRSRPTNVSAAANVSAQIAPGLGAQDIEVYGVFLPLFGLASNELYLVTCGTRAHGLEDLVGASEFDLLESTRLIPTVRPTDHSTRTEPGIYVFRWFDVNNRDIDEIVRLSNEAWVTFEGGFDTEVQALFRQDNGAEDLGKMLLITWYRDLSVWEASRTPSAAARANFVRRSELTLEAKPICTRLAGTA